MGSAAALRSVGIEEEDVDDEAHGRPDLPGAGSLPAANTHVHIPPNFSAFETADGAVRLAALEGLAVLGTSNYHDFRVYRPFADAARAAGVIPLFGVEIITMLDEPSPASESLDPPRPGIASRHGLVNDPSNPGRMYLCGKALTRWDAPPPAAAKRMAAIRGASDDRIRRMIELVSGQFAEAGIGRGPDQASIADAVAKRAAVPVEWVALQERHVARAFQEFLFAELAAQDRAGALQRLIGGSAAVDTTDAVAVQETLRSGLMKAGRPAFVPEAAVSFEDGYALVLGLGGIPCYPILADGTLPICPFEDPPEALVERLIERRIYCAELIPGRNDPAVVDRYVTALRRAGIIVLAGTEHNTQRMVPMKPTARGGAPLSDAALEAFWEATCVVIAHQALALDDRRGFVDDQGTPAAGFGDSEKRIAHFRELGSRISASRSGTRAVA